MWQIPCKMTNSSSKPLQTLGKWYQPRNPKKNPKPAQKKIPKTISHPYISIYKWQTSAFCSCAIHVTRVRSSIRSSIRGSRMLEIPIGAEPRLICCLVMSRTWHVLWAFGFEKWQEVQSKRMWDLSLGIALVDIKIARSWAVRTAQRGQTFPRCQGDAVEEASIPSQLWAQ